MCSCNFSPGLIPIIRNFAEEFIVFANRGSSSLGYFDVGDEVDTFDEIDLMEANVTSEPMYVSTSNPNCEDDQPSNVLIGMFFQHILSNHINNLLYIPKYFLALFNFNHNLTL